MDIALSPLSLLASTLASDPASLKIWAYTIFLGLVAFILALDLGVFHKEAHEVSMKEAAGWSVVWVTCGLAFAVVVYFAYERHWLGLGLSTPMYSTHELAGKSAEHPLIISGEVGGRAAAEQYLTGYLVEKSLAMDNIFVIALVFAFFAIPAKYQHRVLFWGILGALLMRGGMIFVGAELILNYQWILIVFGVFLILTALKMALIRGNDDPSQNIAVKLCKRFFPTVDYFDGQKFFTIANGRRAVTPLFLALVIVEVTDLIFAVDSIPAIFAITPDPFIVLTSNIFAMLGLRSLYFCLAALIKKFRYLKPALILILAFVGVKLLLLSAPPYLHLIGLPPAAPIKLSTGLSLGVIVTLLTGAVVLSVVVGGRDGETKRRRD